jgi:hypothetical protein
MFDILIKLKVGDLFCYLLVMTVFSVLTNIKSIQISIFFFPHVSISEKQGIICSAYLINLQVLSMVSLMCLSIKDGTCLSVVVSNGSLLSLL